MVLASRLAHQGDPINKGTTLVTAFCIALAACSSSSGDDAPTLTVEDGDSVEVHYVLTDPSGEVIDSSRASGTPFVFTVGSGAVISGFDDAVRGLTVGEVRTVDLPPEEAYGEPNPDLIFDVPIAPSQSDVAVGDVVFVNNSQRAVVIAIDGSTATVDANHELAGTTLTFEIELLAIIRG
jgi:FKBP-type peptidyl-prolyl cis-trans isomerase 2